jgi:hypothetical protein
MATQSQPLDTGAAVPAEIGSTRLGRWLMPSFFDLFFLAAPLWLFMVGDAGWSRMLVDGDTGWHIRTGDLIRQTGQVPHLDPYSFSMAGKPWYAWEWLTDVLYSYLVQGAGLKGLLLFSGILFSFFAGITFRHMVARGANIFVALLLGLMCVSVGTAHLLARPHVWTLAFLPVLMWLIHEDRKQPSKWIWLVVPWTVLWVNVHGGWLALPVILGIVAAGSGVEAWAAGSGPQHCLRGEKWSASRRYSVLAMACVAASLVNPYGYQLHVHVLKYMNSSWIKEFVHEFQSPAFRGETMAHFEIALFAGVAVAVLQMMRRRFVEPLLILFWAHSSLESARHMLLYMAVVLPPLAEELMRLWNAWVKGRSKQSVAGIVEQLAQESRYAIARTSVWIVIPWLLLLTPWLPVQWPADFPKDRFPVALVTKHAELLSSTRVLADDDWGDYLIYRLAPRGKVFFDGRTDFYGAEMGNQYIWMVNGRWDWKQLLQKHGIETALIKPDFALAQLMKESGEWDLIEDKGQELLFVRKGIRDRHFVQSALMKRPEVADGRR